MPFIVGGAILGGAVLSGAASNMAAGQQAGAANNANAMQYNFYNQTRSDLQPYAQTGNVALNQLRGLTGLPSQDGSVAQNPNAQLIKPFGLDDFQASPAYNFNLQQGQQAIDKAANARGNFYAPQTLQDISKFSQGLASNEFQNAFSNYNTNQQNVWNRLYGLSNLGQASAAGTAQAGGNAANQIGAATIGAGNNQAAGTIGVGNALTGGLQNGYNAYMWNQILQQQQNSIGLASGAGT